MAANPETTSKLRRKDLNTTNPPAARPDNVDTIVSDFLEELTGISAEIKQVRQPKAEASAETPALFEIEQAPRVSALELAIPKEELCPESELDFGAIDKEIDATLLEMESQRPAGIPAMNRIGSTPEPLSPPVKSPKQPVAASAPTPVGKSAVAPAARKIPGHDWDRLDIFRTDIASARSSNRRKATYIALAAAALLLVLIFFLVFASGSIL